MASSATRWNLVVSTDADLNLRQFLASQGGGRKGDLSKFVEEAVMFRIFQLRVDEIKAGNADVPPEELQSVIDDAVREVRAERRSRTRATPRKA